MVGHEGPSSPHSPEGTIGGFLEDTQEGFEKGIDNGADLLAKLFTGGGGGGGGKKSSGGGHGH